VNVVRLEYAPRSLLGRHPAGRPQIVAVVAGSGPDGIRRRVVAGDAVGRETGEAHESGADGTAMVAPDALAPSDAPD
jgi:quercetin dioxygenase-like cupin family protein